MDLTDIAPPAAIDPAAGEADPPRPLQHLSDEELEDGLAGLAGHLAATQAALLAHVLELDIRGLWGRHGAKSPAQWLSWRLGIGIGTARQYLRVGHALLDLPSIAAAFADGRLSYCKVRAITRVATPVNEAELLEIALGCTGSQLERAVRAYRGLLTEENSASATLRRAVHRRVNEDGSVSFTIRVAPDEAPVIDNALEMALRVVLDDDGAPTEVPEETELAAELTHDPPIVRAQADAFLLIAESFVATGPVGQRGDGMEVLLHADLDDLTDLLRDEADQPPAGQANPPTGTPPPATGRGPARTTSVDGQPLLSQTALRRICETSVRAMAHAPDGRPIDLGRTARDASPRQRRVLHHRDKHCRFPGCTQRRRLIPHHVHWWSLGGPTDLDNLVLLCPAHHRAVHEVGYQVSAHGHGRFSFRTPTGRPLDTAGRIEDPPDDAPAFPRIAWQPTRLPAWGGERLNLALLIDPLIANALINAGHDLPNVPPSVMPRLLREAIGWPHIPGWPRKKDVTTAA